MSSDTQNPLSGHPPTAKTNDQAGRLLFRVTPCELTPFRAELANDMPAVFGAMLVVACITILICWSDPELWHVVMFMSYIALGSMYLCWAFQKFCRITTEIELGVDSIRVKRWTGWHSYDRGVEHRFLLLPHDRAEDERRRNDLAVREAAAKGEAVQPPVYYGESFHVVLVYAGHRIDFLTVFGMREAAAVVARLQYCDRLLNQEAKRGNGGGNARAGDDWHNAPGGLDDD